VDNQYFQHRVTLLRVWASWCASCLQENAVWQRIVRTYPVYLVGLNYKDRREAAQSWLQHYGNPHRANIFDPRGQLAIDLGVYGTPELFLIDRSGMIRYKHVGPMRLQTWREKIWPQLRRLQSHE